MSIRIVILFTMLLYAVTSPVPAWAQTGVNHYGYYLDDWGVALTPARVDAIKSYTNTHSLVNNNLTTRRQSVDLLASRGMKAILKIGYLFHEIPEVQWAANVDRFASEISGLNNHIAAMYIMDKPYNHGWTFNQLNTATNLIKSKFPSIPTMAMFLGNRVGNGVPVNLDWVGMEVYPGNKSFFDTSGFPWEWHNVPFPGESNVDARDIYDNAMNEALSNARSAIAAAGAGPKDIIIAGQAFHEGMADGEFTLPPPPELYEGFFKDTYWQTVNNNADVTGLLWFALVCLRQELWS